MSLVKFDRIGRGVCSILLNRPAKRNAVNLDLSRAIQWALDEFERDETSKVAILAGTGGNFCSGYDLSEIVDLNTGMPDICSIEKLLWPIKNARLCDRKIVIASIDGHAAGFGFELALRCDFRVAERDARLGFLNRRFGVPIMNGGTVILPKLVGYSRALEMIGTGKAQLVSESIQHGVVNQLADVGCGLGKALNLARCLIKFPQDALMHDLNKVRDRDQTEMRDLLIRERTEALEFLRRSGPLDLAVKFINGQIGRHGNTDLGNTMAPNPDVTL